MVRIIENIPARNQVRGNEEADPGHEDKEGRGDVIVEDELEAPPLDLNPEATDGVVTNVPPVEDILHGMERDHPHVLQQDVLPLRVLVQGIQHEGDLVGAVQVAAHPELALLQDQD